MKVERVDSLNLKQVHDIMMSNKISEYDKAHFVQNNKNEIKEVMRTEMTPAEFKRLMESRALVKFQPILNSFKKRGDKKLLAIALDVEPSDVNDYIEEVRKDIRTIDDMSYLPVDKMEKLKTYVYRHGSKREVVTFLDYELGVAKDKLEVLYRTLEYHSGGVADYFIRPIHRLDNKTLVRIYNIINKNLDSALAGGEITQEQNDKASKWALIQIYKLQNNNKLINAIKTYKTLKA